MSDTIRPPTERLLTAMKLVHAIKTDRSPVRRKLEVVFYKEREGESGREGERERDFTCCCCPFRASLGGTEANGCLLHVREQNHSPGSAFSTLKSAALELDSGKQTKVVVMTLHWSLLLYRKH